MAIHWRAVEQYFPVVLGLFFKFYPVCNFGQFINLGLGTISSERVKHFNQSKRSATCNILKFWLNYIFNDRFQSVHYN